VAIEYGIAYCTWVTDVPPEDEFDFPSGSCGVVPTILESPSYSVVGRNPLLRGVANIIDNKQIHTSIQSVSPTNHGHNPSASSLTNTFTSFLCTPFSPHPPGSNFESKTRLARKTSSRSASWDSYTGER